MFERTRARLTGVTAAVVVALAMAAGVGACDTDEAVDTATNAVNQISQEDLDQARQDLEEAEAELEAQSNAADEAYEAARARYEEAQRQVQAILDAQREANEAINQP